MRCSGAGCVVGDLSRGTRVGRVGRSNRKATATRPRGPDTATTTRERSGWKLFLSSFVHHHFDLPRCVEDSVVDDRHGVEQAASHHTIFPPGLLWAPSDFVRPAQSAQDAESAIRPDTSPVRRWPREAGQSVPELLIVCFEAAEQGGVGRALPLGRIGRRVAVGCSGGTVRSRRAGHLGRRARTGTRRPGGRRRRRSPAVRLRPSAGVWWQRAGGFARPETRVHDDVMAVVSSHRQSPVVVSSWVIIVLRLARTAGSFRNPGLAVAGRCFD